MAIRHWPTIVLAIIVAWCLDWGIDLKIRQVKTWWRMSWHNWLSHSKHWLNQWLKLDLLRGLSLLEILFLFIFWIIWCGLGLIEWLQRQWRIYRNPVIWDFWAWLKSPYFFTIEEKRAWRRFIGCDWSELDWHSRKDFRQHGLAEKRTIDWTLIVIAVLLVALLILIPLLLRPRPFG